MTLLDEAPPQPGGTTLAATIASISVACYAAYAWTALMRLDLLDHRAEMLAGLVVFGALLVAAVLQPLTSAALVLLLVPFFGNHPGGRLMELINLPLAASAAGLAIEARRLRKPVPQGAIWVASVLYLATVVVAIVPALPGMWVRAAALNSWPVTLADGLTAAADTPLYSLSSTVGTALCVLWALAFMWRAPANGRHIVRLLLYVFVVVVGLGILDYLGVISLVHSYMLRIDPRKPDVNGFQAVFWNPGWFAWYFVMLFGLGVGYVWTAPAKERLVWGVMLAVAYAFFFANPQRGGLIALHVSLAVAGLVALKRSAGSRVARNVGVAAAVATAAVVATAYTFEFIPRSLESSLFRLLERPEEATLSNSIRLRLWAVTMRMWQDAPMFGIGEGSFGWRFTEYAPPDSALYTTVHADAHSTWMQILATRGAMGVIAFGMLIWVVVRALTTRRAPSSDYGVTLGVALSLVAFLVYSTVQGMFYLQGIQVLFWFLVCLAAAGDPAARAAAAARGGGSRRWPLIAAAAAVALVIQGFTARPAFARASEQIARQPRGFYPVERGAQADRSWRWSAGKQGTLCLQPRSSRAVVLLAAGDPRPDTYPRTVTLRIGDEIIQRIPLANGAIVSSDVTLTSWRAAAAAPAFGECTGQPNEVRLTVEVDRTWNPLADGVAGDPRTLGVQLFEPVWEGK